jgi:hypothetical protein
LCPPGKGDLVRGDTDRARSIGGCRNATGKMRNRYTIVARVLPISGRSFSFQLDRCRLKKKAGHLTVNDAGPARGSKCAIDYVNFAVAQFFVFQDCTTPLLAMRPARGARGRRPMPPSRRRQSLSEC